MIETAECYKKGLYTGEEDYVNAYAWFALGANQTDDVGDDPYSPSGMASIYMRRTAKDGKLTKKQIKHALAIARDIKKMIYTNHRY